METLDRDASAHGPEELVRVLLAAASTIATTPAPTPASGDRAAWVEVLQVCQRIVNSTTAVQDDAMARLAAIEPEFLDDGTEVESHRSPGHVALDAPDVVAGALSVGHVHAERRVNAAVRLAADGPAGSSTATGLSGLHDAMRAGDLDSYRAGVVTTELELAPAEVAEAVIASLGDHLASEPGPQLRRRCRRILARICPDLLRERATRSRAECGLHRWVAEPGVDRWEGTFPSEDAMRAWAAVDALAQRLVAEGQCERVDQARAQALIDLVTGAATIETIVTLTIPAETTPGTATTSETATETSGDDTDDDTKPCPGSDAPHPEDNRDRHATDDAATYDESIATPETTPEETRSADDDTSTYADDDANANDTSAYADRDTDGDGDGDHDTPHDARRTCRGADAEREASPSGRSARAATRETGPAPTGPVDRARPSRSARSADDLVEVADPRGGEPLLIPRGWLDTLRDQGLSTLRFRVCDTVTGALLDDVIHPGYRPPQALAALVRQRDARCRFPGCSVAARFCDLDHVRPWPTGPTSAANLMCLCRRHHRIKQRPGWRVRLDPDGVAAWTDPTGLVRTTQPVDSLHAAILPAPPMKPSAARSSAGAARPGTDLIGSTPGSVQCTDLVAPTPGTATTPTPNAALANPLSDDAQPDPIDEHSALEFTLEHLTPVHACRLRMPVSSRRVRLDVCDDPASRYVLAPDRPVHRRVGPRIGAARHLPDEPPF